MHDATPFAEIFSTGKFPVRLAMATTENDARVAFSRIIFSDSMSSAGSLPYVMGRNKFPLQIPVFIVTG
jgi:hypothetical protein